MEDLTIETHEQASSLPPQGGRAGDESEPLVGRDRAPVSAALPAGALAPGVSMPGAGDDPGGAHHPLSPSKFPAWAACPAYEPSDEERADATEGTLQHEALSTILEGRALPALSDDAQPAVEWAADRITRLAKGQRIQSERRVAYRVEDAFEPTGRREVYFGTADALFVWPPGNAADLFDFKSGAESEAGHRAQLALPGYRLQERRAPREIRDLNSVFERTGLPPEEFVNACKVSMSKLAAAYAKARGLPKTRASAELEALLTDLFTESAPSVALVADSSTAE